MSRISWMIDSQCIKIYSNDKVIEEARQGPPTYTVKGETRTKYGLQYVHFNSECFLEYAHAKHEIK